MTIAGNVDDFSDSFPPSLLPWIFRVVVTEWNNFPRTSRNPIENRITIPFVGHLQSCQETRGLPFFFDAKVKLVDPREDTETGELDIRVMHGKRPRVFFAFECKRLNIVYKGKYYSQAGKYIGQEGMGCLLSGKYDGGSDCGGMIAYVMDNDVKRAKSSINNALAAYSESLMIKPPVKLKISSMLSKKDNLCYETVHIKIEKDFTIYHLILPYDVNE